MVKIVYKNFELCSIDQNLTKLHVSNLKRKFLQILECDSNVCI